MDPHDQQWATAQAVSVSDLVIDDVWSCYVDLGGSADAVAVAAYLHGLVLLDLLQRDLVSHAINELGVLGGTAGAGNAVSGSVPPGRPVRIAPYAGDGQGTDTLTGSEREGPDELMPQDGWRDNAWPKMKARLVGMFDPGEAENRRLASLNRTGLIRPVREERFDRLTRLARDTFGVSTAAITFIGATEQFIKSVAGPMGITASKSNSFCAHTIREDRTLVIADASQDVRFTENALVTGSPHIRFYAGHPLTGPGGWRIGALCLMDTEPRTFTLIEQRDLRVLAAQVQTEMIG